MSVSSLTNSPPSFAVYHPTNWYPLLVGYGRLYITCPTMYLKLVGLTLPPFGSSIKVYSDTPNSQTGNITFTLYLVFPSLSLLLYPISTFIVFPSSK